MKTGKGLLSKIAIGRILVEGHNFSFVGIDLQSGALTPSLGESNHRLEFHRVGGAEGKVIDIEEAADPDRGGGSGTSRGRGVDGHVGKLATEGSDEVGRDDLKKDGTKPAALR